MNIDDEKKQLIYVLNELYKNEKDKKEKERLKKIIERLNKKQ